MLDALVYGMADDTAVGEPQTFSRDLEPWPLTALYVLAAVVAGLLASEAVLRSVRSDLRFYARYHKVVLAVCVKKMPLGVLLASVSALTDNAMPMMDRLVGPGS